MRTSVIEKNIIRVRENNCNSTNDWLAAEEPLEIRLVFGDAANRKQQSISITMRTPGEDFELATGFLFTEGIIGHPHDIETIKHCNGLAQNVVKVELRHDVQVDIKKLERNFYTTSSCGVCGKSSIDAVRTVCRIATAKKDTIQVDAELLYKLPSLLRQQQSVFKETGGLHGCALFTSTGQLVLSKEDVGRHNALDKLIGCALQQFTFPLDNFLLLLSGRASFELIQKAWMAGITVVAAVGAPSSLAVQMAEDFGITLIGFLRDKSFNIYCGSQRIVMPVYENSY